MNFSSFSFQNLFWTRRKMFWPCCHLVSVKMSRTFPQSPKTIEKFENFDFLKCNLLPRTVKKRFWKAFQNISPTFCLFQPQNQKVIAFTDFPKFSTGHSDSISDNYSESILPELQKKIHSLSKNDRRKICRN